MLFRVLRNVAFAPSRDTAQLCQELIAPTEAHFDYTHINTKRTYIGRKSGSGTTQTLWRLLLPICSLGYGGIPGHVQLLQLLSRASLLA